MISQCVNLLLQAEVVVVDDLTGHAQFSDVTAIPCPKLNVAFFLVVKRCNAVV